MLLFFPLRRDWAVNLKHPDVFQTQNIIYYNYWTDFFYRSDGTESPILEEQESANSEKPKQLIKYGELVILG